MARLDNEPPHINETDINYITTLANQAPHSIFSEPKPDQFTPIGVSHSMIESARQLGLDPSGMPKHRVILPQPLPETSASQLDQTLDDRNSH